QLAADTRPRRRPRPARQLALRLSRIVRTGGMATAMDARVTRSRTPGVRGVAILGSTGSIGTTALRVLSRQRDRFRVAALTAFNNAVLLSEQVAAFQPSF